MKGENMFSADPQPVPKVDMKTDVLMDRGCTDCICCIIYVVFLAAFIFVFAYGIAKGDPTRLATIFDSDGKQCGHVEDGLEAYPYGYLYQPLKGLKKAVCVKECPKWTDPDPRVTTMDCSVGPKLESEFGKKTCEYSGDFDFNKLPGEYTKYATEKLLIYKSKGYFGRFCLPSGITAGDALNWAKNMTAAVQAAEKFEEVFDDMKILWKHFAILGCIAIVLSIISLLLTRCCAGVFVWVILLLFLAIIFAGAVISMQESNRLKALQLDQTNGTNTAATETSLASGFVDNFSSSYINSKNLYYISIFLYVLGGVCTLVVLFSISSIAISIAVIKTASEFIAKNCCIIFTPILISLFMLGFIFLWIYGVVHLWSVGELKAGGLTAFAQITWDPKTKYFMIFYFFGLLWNVAFINYMTIFIVGCTVAFWYFSYDNPDNRPRMPIMKSVWWAFRYHLGSLAFGAFLLAVIQFVKFCLMYVAAYVQSLQKKGIENKLVTWVIKCMICYVSCLERFIKYISSLGYAQIAISGQNFCSSCATAFKLLMGNPMKFGMVAAMGNIFAFIGKLFVAAASGLIAFYVIKLDTTTKEKLNSVTIPIVFCVFIGYFVASVFFSVYGVAADSVIICFFHSKQLDSSKQFSAPPSMRSFYDKYSDPNPKKQE